MAHRKESEKKHAKKLKRKSPEEELIEEAAPKKSGPTGWEEIEAIAAPAQKQGKESFVFASDLLIRFT